MHKFLILVAALLLGVAAQAAPGDVFLLQIPGINGSVNFSKYRGWILVNSFSTGITTATSNNTGGGGSSGKPMCQPLMVIKPLDSTSPELALAAATGKRFATVTLAALGSGGGGEREFLRFVLKNATITSVLFGGDNVSSSRTESLTISAQQIQISSTPQSADGATGTTSTTEIDCQAGTVQ
ncbi:MAG TPA: type VI secretion system tube protein Hcp [Steroidobacteraceae bacterium]|jgi:type VI secretion system Hcp family effector